MVRLQHRHEEEKQCPAASALFLPTQADKSSRPLRGAVLGDTCSDIVVNRGTSMENDRRAGWPITELRAAASVPFSQARAMPKSIYTSTEFVRQEEEHVFAREWVCAGRSDALNEPGDYVTMEVAGEPVIVLRDHDRHLRALSNVCRHRMSVMLTGSGNTRRIMCPYHAWTYDLGGALHAAPGMSRNPSFCKETIRLPELRCAEWQGWIMVTLNPDASPLSERLAPLESLVGYLRMENYVETFRERLYWNTNWKVLAENFMESYHLPACHSGTIGGSVSLDKMSCPEGHDAFNHHWFIRDDSVPLALAHPTNTRLQGDERRITWLISVYPSLFITLTPGYFWYLSLTPDGAGHVEILFGGGMAPEFASDPDASAHFDALKALLDEVNEEDRRCTEQVFRGLSARLSEPGPLSHLERPIYEFARYLASRIEETENV